LIRKKDREGKMAGIDVSELVTNMLNAAKDVLGRKWPEAKDYAETAFAQIGEAISFIETQRALGKMPDEKARLHLEIQKNTSKTVMLTLEGLGTVAVEAAINAALKVIKDTVNTALGFVLI
jgi:hypothetical protein